MKQMFTNDIFPESVVAGHAVRVPVTRNLSGDMTGFLPVHCMHQLLKSRVFSKHKVDIKNRFLPLGDRIYHLSSN